MRAGQKEADLHIGLVFQEFLGSPVQEPDVRRGLDADLAFQFKNHSQDSVSCRVLRTEVDVHVFDPTLAQGPHH